MQIIVKDPDYYHKTQHAMRHDYDGDLHEGHMITISKTGYWDGKRHYGVFVQVFDEITGSQSAVNIKHLKQFKDKKKES